MTPLKHARQIFRDIFLRGVAKYMGGQRKYKTKLWLASMPFLIENAKQEVLDQGSYLWTLEQRTERLRMLIGTIFEVIENGEEPLDDSTSKEVQEVREILGL